MTTRGIHKPGTTTVTTAMIGEFKTNSEVRDNFFRLIK
jgi:GTP cyclohydrolase I